MGPILTCPLLTGDVPSLTFHLSFLSLDCKIFGEGTVPLGWEVPQYWKCARQSTYNSTQGSKLGLHGHPGTEGL